MSSSESLSVVGRGLGLLDRREVVGPGVDADNGFRAFWKVVVSFWAFLFVGMLKRRRGYRPDPYGWPVVVVKSSRLSGTRRHTLEPALR